MRVSLLGVVLAACALTCGCGDDGGSPVSGDVVADGLLVPDVAAEDALDAGPMAPQDASAQDAPVDAAPAVDVADVTGVAPDVSDAWDESDASDGADVADVTDVEPGEPWALPEPLGWEACSLTTSGGWGGGDAECLTLDVPADWTDLTGPTLELFVKRLPASSAPARGSLWLLQGGPGGSGVGLEGYAASMHEALPDLDIYLPDHRGTGRSSRLGCAAGEASGGDAGIGITLAEWPACLDALEAQWGELLGLFSTTQAAHDVGELGPLLRRAGTGADLFVYGVSYGTFWGHRYLQLYPDQAAGVVLDSVCSPGSCDLARYDERYDALGRELLARCLEHEVCAAHLGPDPVAFADETLESLDEGHCPGLLTLGITRATLQRSLGAYLASWWYRVLVPPILFRVSRCEEQDVEALSYLVPAPTGESDPAADAAALLSMSTALLYHVTFSELWGPDPPSVDALHEIVDGTIFTLDLGPSAGAVQALGWPAYTVDDDLASTLTTSEAPVLVIQGTLDPQTPLEVASPLIDAIEGAAQHVVIVEDAAHGVYTQSPVEIFDFEAGCGGEMVHAFFEEPGAPIDDACLEDMQRLDFGLADVMGEWIGLPDIWEDPLGLLAFGLAAPPAEQERVRRLLRDDGPRPF